LAGSAVKLFSGTEQYQKAFSESIAERSLTQTERWLALKDHCALSLGAFVGFGKVSYESVNFSSESGLRTALQNWLIDADGLSQ